jgi:hypothetical protein
MSDEEKNVYKAIYRINYEAYKKEMKKYERLKCCSVAKSSSTHELLEVSDKVIKPDAVHSLSAIPSGVRHENVCPAPPADAGDCKKRLSGDPFNDVSPLVCAPTPIRVFGHYIWTASPAMQSNGATLC